MKTILVLSSHPAFEQAVQAALDATRYRTVARLNAEQAEPLLAHGLVSACLLDAGEMGVEGIWSIERLRRFDSRVPIIVFTESAPGIWEEEAMLRGVSHVLAKPVRPKLLNSVLERLWPAPASARPAVNVPPGNTAIFARTATDPEAGGRFVNAAQTLDVLRGFSPILTHSLDAEAMLRQFLQFLRDILRLNRAAIFLNRPASPPAEVAPVDSRRLRSAAAIGIAGGLLEHFELSLDSGIGAQVTRLGRILRRDSDESRFDPEVQKEFELLGAQVAVPITGRDTTVGVAVFDGRITGEPLVNTELELVFHLLEQLGLALRNISLHDQLAGNHEMMAAVLRELDSACVVIGRDLKVLHANKAATRHFGRRDTRGAALEFADLPPALGAKIYQVLKTGAALEPFRYSPEHLPGTVFKVSVLPFQHGNASVPVSALLTAEDLTEGEQLARLERENVRLRLLNSMSDRLVNEIGNAITPLSIYNEQPKESHDDPEVRQLFDESFKRIMRLKNQMHFLAREHQPDEEPVALDQLLSEAYSEAVQHLPKETKDRLPAGRPAVEPGNFSRPLAVQGDRESLKHAFAEIILNALQANPHSPKIGLALRAVEGGLEPSVIVEVRDSGAGFSPEAASKVTAPFYAGRVGGVGLGLTVSQKVVETHQGRLEIVPSETGVVRVILPLAAGRD